MDITNKAEVCCIPFYLSLSICILKHRKVFIVIPLSIVKMAEFGSNVSFYAQDEIIKQVDNLIEKYPGTFQSRSHFINCAINRELRRIKEQPPEIETE